MIFSKSWVFIRYASFEQKKRRNGNSDILILSIYIYFSKVMYIGNLRTSELSYMYACQCNILHACLILF